MIRVGKPNPIFDLFPPDSARFITPESERDGLALLQTLNQRHLATRDGDSRLDARIASSNSRPSCNSARRRSWTFPANPAQQKGFTASANRSRKIWAVAVSSPAGCSNGVFASSNSGAAPTTVSRAATGTATRIWRKTISTWHEHGQTGCRAHQRPQARGLLDDTIVMWTTEFGRMPCSQGAKGRDHNPFTFTNWLAGGGIKGGVSYGESDEWSYKAVVNPTYCYDVHATVLHLLGIDHTKLTFRTMALTGD